MTVFMSRRHAYQAKLRHHFPGRHCTAVHPSHARRLGTADPYAAGHVVCLVPGRAHGRAGEGAGAKADGVVEIAAKMRARAAETSSGGALGFINQRISA